MCCLRVALPLLDAPHRVPPTVLRRPGCGTTAGCCLRSACGCPPAVVCFPPKARLLRRLGRRKPPARPRDELRSSPSVCSPLVACGRARAPPRNCTELVEARLHRTKLAHRLEFLDHSLARDRGAGMGEVNPIRTGGEPSSPRRRGSGWLVLNALGEYALRGQEAPAGSVEPSKPPGGAGDRQQSRRWVPAEFCPRST